MSIQSDLTKIHGRAALKYDTLRWAHASRMAQFPGGTWIEHELPNGKSIDYSESLPEVNGHVRVENYISGVTADMDKKSAGAALSILALAHTVELLYDKLSDDAGDELIQLLEEVKNGVFADKTLDHRGIFRIID